MRLSANSLKEYTKCGYAFYLKRMLQQPEPGKKSYGMLQGRVMGEAVQQCATFLNTNKYLDDAVIGSILADTYAAEFSKAQVPQGIEVEIKRLLTVGTSPDTLESLYLMSPSINCSEFELKIPARLKNGTLSSDKRKPTLGAIVMHAYADLLWYFEPETYMYCMTRDAVQVEHEYHFTMQMDTDLEVDGYFDQRLHLPDGKVLVTEFKSDKTAYSQELVNRMIQTVTYQLASPDDVVQLVDLTHHSIYPITASAQTLTLTSERYKQTALALTHHIYTPACGTDPFKDKQILCGYKCGGCPYGTTEVDEDE